MQGILKASGQQENSILAEQETRKILQSDGNVEVVVLGAVGSPYTRKVIAALRYLRVPYRFVPRGSKADVGFPIPPGPPLLPNVVFVREWRAMADSTFIIKEVERLMPARDRSVRHVHPAMSLLMDLVEDFADEWLTKAMYHYRWSNGRDASQAAWLLPSWSQESMLAGPEKDLRTVGKLVAERQIDRLSVVGSSSQTKSIIEDSYIQLLRCLDAHLNAGYLYLFGDRPSIADFALFGQLTQLIGIDPTSSALAETIAPRVVAWVHHVEDLSGSNAYAKDWRINPENELPPTFVALLRSIVGRYYVPYMLANARAWIDGGEKGKVEFIDGPDRHWFSQPFKYQFKCVMWLREGHQRLSAEHRQCFDRLIRGTGCEALFSEKLEAKL